MQRAPGPAPQHGSPEGFGYLSPLSPEREGSPPSPAAAGTDIGTLHPGQLPCFTDDADGAASPWPLSVAGYGAYGARFTVLPGRLRRRHHPARDPAPATPSPSITSPIARRSAHEHHHPGHRRRGRPSELTPAPPILRSHGRQPRWPRHLAAAAGDQPGRPGVPAPGRRARGPGRGGAGRAGRAEYRGRPSTRWRGALIRVQDAIEPVGSIEPRSESRYPPPSRSGAPVRIGRGAWARPGPVVLGAPLAPVACGTPSRYSRALEALEAVPVATKALPRGPGRARAARAGALQCR